MAQLQMDTCDLPVVRGKQISVTSALQLEKADALNAPLSMGGWMLVERYVRREYTVGGSSDYLGRIGNVIRVVGVTSPSNSWKGDHEPITHYHLHLFARAFMLGHRYPMAFGSGHCKCPTGEADIKWYNLFYFNTLGG